MLPDVMAPPPLSSLHYGHLCTPRYIASFSSFGPHEVSPLQEDSCRQVRSSAVFGRGHAGVAEMRRLAYQGLKFSWGEESLHVGSSCNWRGELVGLQVARPANFPRWSASMWKGGANNGTSKPAESIQFVDGENPPTTVLAPSRRIVAIGDLHGDFKRTQWALQLAGVLSKDGLHRWIGGSTVLVQVGDILDRGDDEIAIMSLLAFLGKQARSKGGAVFQVNGNHETLNVACDFRYATPGGFHEAEAFSEYCEEQHGGNWEAAFAEWRLSSQERKANRGLLLGSWLFPIFNPLRMHKGIAARTLLFTPGGPLAKELANHGVVLKVNDWLFAHGGVLPHHVEYGLHRMNNEVSQWMKGDLNRWGQRVQMPFIATRGFDSIVWSRLYSREEFEKPEDKIQACAVLSATLEAAGARGLVVGHTPQTNGANCECKGRIWRIDVGMSSGVYHALPEVLEITDNKVRLLRMAEEFLHEDDEDLEGWSSDMQHQRSNVGA